MLRLSRPSVARRSGRPTATRAPLRGCRPRIGRRKAAALVIALAVGPAAASHAGRLPNGSAGAAYPAGSGGQAADPAEERFERLCAVVNESLKANGVPGAAVGVLHGGRSFARGFGVTSADHPLTVTDGTLFQIGSITKTFTGTLIMRLVDADRVALDARVQVYLPDFRVGDPAASSKATVRDLLTHMGGWVGDHFDDTGSGDDALARIVKDMAALEQLAPIGTVWSYNNSGFYVAGRIVERVTGNSYEAALQELVLDPLGLKESFIFPQDVMTQRFAVGHGVTPRGAQVARPWALPRAVHAAGGLACSVRDVLRYARFHIGDGAGPNGKRLLRSESLLRMRTPVLTKAGADDQMGLTWNITEVNGVRVVSHDGGTVGQASLLVLVPERGFAFALLTNAGRGAVAARDASRWALREHLGLEITDPAPLPATEADLRPYVGRYRRPFAEVALTLAEGKLLAQVTFKQGFPTRRSPIPPPGPPVPLSLYANDRFVVLEGSQKGERAEIVRRPDGSIGWLRFGSRIHPRVVGSASERPPPRGGASDSSEDSREGVGVGCPERGTLKKDKTVIFGFFAGQ